MNNIVKNVGLNIKNLRRSKKLSQEALADKIGVNIRQVARIEAGKSFMGAETIYNICVALNVQPYDLFSFKLDEVVGIPKKISKEELINNLLDEAFTILKDKKNVKQIKKVI